MGCPELTVFRSGERGQRKKEEKGEEKREE